MTQTTEGTIHSRKAAASGLAAIFSVLAASSCCLPLLPFIAAAGAAGSSTLFTTLRPYLLGLSVLFVAIGFYQNRRATQCDCKPSVVSQVLLWMSAVVVVVSILFPQVLADLVARIV